MTEQWGTQWGMGLGDRQWWGWVQDWVKNSPYFERLKGRFSGKGLAHKESCHCQERRLTASAKDSGFGKDRELLERTCLECWDCRE